MWEEKEGEMKLHCSVPACDHKTMDYSLMYLKASDFLVHPDFQILKQIN